VMVLALLSLPASLSVSVSSSVVVGVGGCLLCAVI